MPLSSAGLNLADDLWIELKGSAVFSLLVYLCANWFALLFERGFFCLRPNIFAIVPYIGFIPSLQLVWKCP